MCLFREEVALKAAGAWPHVSRAKPEALQNEAERLLGRQVASKVLVPDR